MTHFMEIPKNDWCVSVNDVPFQLAIAVSFKTLRTLFGEPRDPSKISFNSRYEWDVKDVDNGICCTIYEWMSQGVMPADYPSDHDIRQAPEYKWNIGAKDISSATLLVEWLRSRDPSVRRVSDYGDIISFATERKKYLMKNYTVTELRDVVEKYHLVVPVGANKDKLVDVIVAAETHKECTV